MALDLSRLMKEAHRQARRYAEPGKYRETFAWALKMEWRAEKDRVAREQIVADLAASETPAVTSLRTEILMIEMKDRMTSADFAAVSALKARMAEVSVARA